jgi:hypothetical protein
MTKPTELRLNDEIENQQNFIRGPETNTRDKNE